MSRFSNGPIKWEEIHPRETKAFIAIIIRKKATPLKIVGPYVIIWVNW